MNAVRNHRSHGDFLQAAIRTCHGGYRHKELVPKWPRLANLGMRRHPSADHIPGTQGSYVRRHHLLRQVKLLCQVRCGPEFSGCRPLPIIDGEQ